MTDAPPPGPPPAQPPAQPVHAPQHAPVHATCVAIGAHGVLLTGPSGAGKSDLAMRLIDRGAVLIADDYTLLSLEHGVLTARCPPAIAGRMEVRGIGIVARPVRASAPVALAVALGAEDERMPALRKIVLHGVAIPQIAIDPRRASAPIKVEWALAGASSAEGVQE